MSGRCWFLCRNHRTSCFAASSSPEEPNAEAWVIHAELQSPSSCRLATRIPVQVLREAPGELSTWEKRGMEDKAP
jgi:hypothetical protein